MERYTPQAKEALSLAVEMAESLNHGYVGTEHLLIGLLQEGTGVAAKVLEENGVEEAKVVELVSQLITPDNSVQMGTSIRGIFGEGSENAGNMYELSNQRTLGLSEKEIIELVNKAAVQLNAQEFKVRKAALNARRLEREDETYKSYGVLKYARKMAEKDARVFIGQLIAGETDGLIAFEKENSLYSLLVGIKPANLNLWASRPLDKDETDCVRAAYIREHLPQICSWS